MYPTGLFIRFRPFGNNVFQQLNIGRDILVVAGIFRSIATQFYNIQTWTAAINIGNVVNVLAGSLEMYASAIIGKVHQLSLLWAKSPSLIYMPPFLYYLCALGVTMFNIQIGSGLQVFVGKDRRQSL